MRCDAKFPNLDWVWEFSVWGMFLETDDGRLGKGHLTGLSAIPLDLGQRLVTGDRHDLMGATAGSAQA